MRVVNCFHCGAGPCHDVLTDHDVLPSIFWCFGFGHTPHAYGFWSSSYFIIIYWHMARICHGLARIMSSYWKS